MNSEAKDLEEKGKYECRKLPEHKGKENEHFQSLTENAFLWALTEFWCDDSYNGILASTAGLKAGREEAAWTLGSMKSL